MADFENIPMNSEIEGIYTNMREAMDEFRKAQHAEVFDSGNTAELAAKVAEKKAGFDTLATSLGKVVYNAILREERNQNGGRI